MTLRKAVTAPAAGALLAALAHGPAWAPDHQNLEELLPTTVVDAYLVPYRGREIQSSFRWEENEEGEGRFVVAPRLEFGPFRNFQAEITVPYRAGDTDDADSGDVSLAGFYNFNQETVIVPAFTLGGEVVAPWGQGDEPWQTEVKFILTKTMPSRVHQRIHFNGGWIHAYDAAGNEREDRYEIGLGYSVAVQAQTIFIADVVRSEELREGRENNLVEAGIRYQLTPLTVLTAGGAVGFAGSETDYRVLVGFQHGLARLAFYE
ncbi:MAG: hypothetical protein ACLFWF_07555 [Alphaproteobacteria bacterium]